MLAAINGHAVEVITLHRHQGDERAKVINIAIGPHLILIIDNAKLLANQERKASSFGTPSGFTMTERAPLPKKRKLGDQ